MRKPLCITFCLASLLSGCVTNTVLGDAHESENSVNRLSRVALRMDQDAVLQIMHAPYDKEVFRVGDDRYDVWFYITTITVLDQSRMVPKNLTPLTFRNRRLVGVGYDYYNWLKRRDRMSQQSAKDEAEVLENEGLEIELQKAIRPRPTAAPQQQAQPNQQRQAPAPGQSQQPQPSQKQAPTPPPTQQPQPQPQPNQQRQAPAKPPAQQPLPNQPSPPNPQLGPPPPKQAPPPKQKTVSMSKPPAKAKASKPSSTPDEKSDDPQWDKKDEEINEDAMDQDFDFW